MKLHRVSENCFATLSGTRRGCDANSGLIDLGGGAVIDTQPDLIHGRLMIGLFASVWHGMPKYVINTSEGGDHVRGNQLFDDAEIIAHRSVPARMRRVADPRDAERLLADADRLMSGPMLGAANAGALAFVRQMQQDHDFRGVQLTFPTTLFDDRLVLDLDGTEVHCIYVGPCHQFGDAIVHVEKEGVLFAGDVIFRQCTPTGWSGSYRRWLDALDLIIGLDPEVIVPGHGPLCGIEGAMEMKAYLEYVYEEAQRCFEQGLTPLEASKRIEFGPYAEWRGPERLYLNVLNAYREFRNETAGAPLQSAQVFDALYEVARARGIEMEF